MHEGDSFTILLTDLNNTSISNQVVNVSIIDANGGQNNQSVTTDADGRGNLQLNGLTEGEYTVNVVYGGNENYTTSNVSQIINIEKQITSSGSNSLTSGQSSD